VSAINASVLRIIASWRFRGSFHDCFLSTAFS
jgi:hypothetical protein